ncbi:hypothetical protein ACFFLZ_02505 [Photobacterium aphoticum]|uniref:hypothetical protein n=1 Tax=Photobacterium aphoticum TaxID=754436 RepID=UPI00069D09D3|nr:hypothetical protein [Photobacterium aphoticum]PSU57987.1 hypothetical protein C9I90_07910 [Photobacterium aphoticum]GHA60904.1 hypothetical protein GCM10007086_38420 [Photobacterium aphoticum]
MKFTCSQNTFRSTQLALCLAASFALLSPSAMAETVTENNSSNQASNKISTSSNAVAKPASAGEIQGRNQFYAARYQAACDVPLQTVQVAGSLADAPQLEAIFTDTLGYQFTLNANGDAYLQLAIKEWNEKMLLMTNSDVTIAMNGADITGTKITNQQCPDLKGEIYHINTHEWGSYVLHIHGQPNQSVSVRIVKEVVAVK